MKSLLILITAIAPFGIASADCLSYDMEMIGLVRNAHTVALASGQSACLYQIESLQTWENGECPLSPGEADSALYTDSTCQKKDGDKISGIVSRQGDVFTIGE